MLLFYNVAILASMTFSQLLTIIVEYVWGLPLVILLMGGGFYLLWVSRFLPLLGFVHAIKLVTGQYKHKGESRAEGQISHFQGLTNALAATIGLGNIAGVAVAISQGGPGAIFWMWVASFIGMNTKFFECSLSMMYRGKDHLGETHGGPMFVIEKALPKAFKPLALVFAICGLVGTMALFQTNQLSAYLFDQYQTPKLWTGLVSAGLVAVVLLGGIKRISKVTEKLVPLMCLLYVISCLVIIFINFEKVPAVFYSIFYEAFNGRAAYGGAVGLGVIQVLKIGVKRAGFSNEAGIGTAPMAHSNVKTNQPISEGFVGMLGPFMDTLIVCTMTALAILTSIDYKTVGDVTGIVMTTMAFQQSLPTFGIHLLGAAVLLFSFSTMVGMANYNEKCWNYVFKGRFIFNRYLFIFWFCLTLVYGAVTTPDNVINILDIGYGFMAVPNMFATIYLAYKVRDKLKDYRNNFL